MGPTSNSNQFFGVKVSQVGTPVNQAADTQLVYKSNFSTNLFNGPNGVWKVMEGTRQPTIGNGLTAPQQGFWVAEDGVDVQQATDTQMLFNSSVIPKGVVATSGVQGLSFTTTSTTDVQVTGATVTVTVPDDGSQLLLSFYTSSLWNAGGGLEAVTIWRGAITTGTNVISGVTNLPSSNSSPVTILGLDNPGGGTFTYNVSLHTTSNTGHIDTPYFLMAQLV